ncbi:hypothetical protein QBC47DRAFT_389703 [Echria macrotheca]|uniref:Tafazzin n=1 Tax=Echria macrotheca TaxID=438768 RepID=A0AAJ0B6I3_9PEZI|nr:hypothetical protein QBC47DRAFT_389703 [Echria macrotheca]
MPKKRHQALYSKPPSTAPASHRRSGTQHGRPGDRGVNELLAALRRNRPSHGVQVRPVEVLPTLPPLIRNILQLPEAPPLRPRNQDRRSAPQAGPPPPRSWVSDAARYAAAQKTQQYGEREVYGGRALPGAYLPEEGSLVDLVLRQFVADWDFLKSYLQYCLYDLPDHLRTALISYISMLSQGGVSVGDLRVILFPPEVPDEDEGEARPSPYPANEKMYHLDLTGSVGMSLKLRELSVLLFPPHAKDVDPQESWDVPEELQSTIPRPLLPNLTHLSLAIHPDRAHVVSWRHLLSFASHCSMLTHLSLAFWPEPSLTPNAKLASFDSPTGRPVQYSGTGPYSHSMDDDWAEAIVVLRRLSKSLYELEYLDLTGCGEWFPALAAKIDQDTVDWVGNWGKITNLVLHPGYQLGEDAAPEKVVQYTEIIETATRVERFIRGKRAGRGRPIAVVTAKAPGAL